MVQVFTRGSRLTDRMRAERVGQQRQVLKHELVGLQAIQKQLQILQLVFVQAAKNNFPRLRWAVVAAQWSSARLLSKNS